MIKRLSPLLLFTIAATAWSASRDAQWKKVDDAISKGTMRDAYRPTLYDFIVQEALSFYTSGEQAAAKPQDAFEVAATSPIFDVAEKFIAWKNQTGDTNSPVYKALRLYQDLLAFHLR